MHCKTTLEELTPPGSRRPRVLLTTHLRVHAKNDPPFLHDRQRGLDFLVVGDPAVGVGGGAGGVELHSVDGPRGRRRLELFR